MHQEKRGNSCYPYRRLLELGINSQYLSQYFPGSASHPSTHAVPQSEAQLPTVPQPPPNPPYTGLQDPPHPLPPHTSPASSPSTCSACPSISRQMEIVLSEFDFLRTQLNEMKDLIHYQFTQQTSKPCSTSPPSHSSPQVPPPPCNRTSRHTQTSTAQTTGQPLQRSQKPSTKTLRPIRPLFQPCPWKDGNFPPGPVRYLGPPMPRSSRSVPSSRARSSSMKSSRPSSSQSSAPASSSIPPTSARTLAPPLVTVVLDEDDEEECQISPSVPTPNPDKNSLNF